MLVYWSIRLLPSGGCHPLGCFGSRYAAWPSFYGRELALGQANVVFGASLLSALGALALAFPVVAGLCVAAAFFIKPYGVLFVPWLAITGGRRAVATFLAVVSVGGDFPRFGVWLVGYLELLADWYRTVTSSTAPNLLGADNISFAGMWAKWLGCGVAVATPATLLSSLAALGPWRRCVAEASRGPLAALPRSRTAAATRAAVVASGMGLCAALGNASGCLFD